jgi:hypothetical protein
MRVVDAILEDLYELILVLLPFVPFFVALAIAIFR